MSGTHRVCLLLGSNIAPETNLPAAIALIRQHAKVLQASSVWESEAVGSDGPRFLNQAILIETVDEPGGIKRALISPIEAQLGRQRGSDKNAPRTIDIDIVFFDDDLHDTELWLHAHRAVPVAELLPDVRSAAGGETLRAAATRLAAVTPMVMRADVTGPVRQT